MTMHELVRALLERAIEDGLVTFVDRSSADDPDPRQFTDEDVQPCVNLLRTGCPTSGCLRAAGGKCRNIAMRRLPLAGDQG